MANYNRSWREQWENDPTRYIEIMQKNLDLTNQELAGQLCISVQELEEIKNGFIAGDIYGNLPLALKELRQIQMTGMEYIPESQRSQFEANDIKYHRQRLNIPASKIAKMFGIARDKLDDYENGKYSLPFAGLLFSALARKQNFKVLSMAASCDGGANWHYVLRDGNSERLLCDGSEKIDDDKYYQSLKAITCLKCIKHLREIPFVMKARQ